ncbi:TIGR02996 domain-containing protein [Nonomuraea sp. FMUSA5-5]|uniref:TIGR02996 domain-containing protein n=1 Tax=Nonomuraea composti TaxID=2720023 RepID=A0ABX1BIA7_9ACTN|nr:TIGR02996 domain-containing protein [Nonomuraea sp. FMUSA5-5]NJP95494.1 TIGR02996 domain-containing protein [Nonomuraea sp. FMUSA5-5]
MKVMAIEEALRAHPDDLTAWHAYSDRLLERGDARGTLIRLEQRLPRTRPADRPALEREIADLVAEHEDRWDDGLPGAARVRSRRYGFATEVAVTWSDDVREVVEQVLRAPFVTTLRLTSNAADDDDDDEEWDEDWDEEDEDGWDLAVDRGAPRPGRLDVRALAGLDLGRLTELDLSYLSVGFDGAEFLAGLFVSDRLRALDLRYCRVADTGLAALAARPQLAGLRRLHLQRNRLTADGVRSLHRLTELTELDLRYNDLGEAGARALLAAPFACSLTRLWLYDSDVGEDGVRELAQAANLPPGLRSMWRCV